jgi:hypothetical protein
VSVAGSFVASADPGAGAGALDGVPVYPVGVPVEVSGQRLTPLSSTDIDGACARQKGGATEPCQPGTVPVEAPLRLVELEVCVTLDGQAARPVFKDGFGAQLFAGDALMPEALGVPLTVADPAVTSTPLVGTALDQGMCVTGHALAGSRGPLVLWFPPDGEPAVAWTLDPVALPPTADGPVAGPGTSPVPSAGPVAGTLTLTGGFADVTHDGDASGSADDLELTEGSLETRADGSAQLHLRFASPAGATLAVDMPGVGTHAVPAGSAGPDLAVGYSVGDATVAPGDAACTVDVAATEAGGVTGTWVCDLGTGGMGSGSFFANP